MIRLAVLGFWHEANSFSTHLVDREQVESRTQVGQDVIRAHEGGSSTIAGFLAAAKRHADVDVVPLVMSSMIPAGPLTAAALEYVTDGMLTAIETHGPFDGALIAMHGAAVSEDVHDVDGYLLDRLRSVLGSVPIGVSLDLHANISTEMCRHADVLNTYRTNPHVDAAEVADEIAELVIRAVRGLVEPTMALVPVPAAINILRQNTDLSPMKDLMLAAREVQLVPGVLSVSIAEGFPYADVPEMGMSVVVVTDNDLAAARTHADHLAREVWDRRAEFVGTALSPEAALRTATDEQRWPTLLLDAGDNIGGGSPGDSVAILNAARELQVDNLLIVVNDPASARACVEAGVDRVVRLTIGAKVDANTGPPVVDEAHVLAVHDGVFQDRTGVHAGFDAFDGGPSAAVRLQSGQTVVLTSKLVPPFSAGHLSTLGLAPADYEVIVAKGVHSPLASYGPHVASIVFVDSPGITSADLNQFPYRHRRRPLYPLDGDLVSPTSEFADQPGWR
jgi:microcystin degradation protein MlrC